MSDVTKFCDKTSESISKGIDIAKRELNQQLIDNEREEIISAQKWMTNQHEQKKG